MSSEVAYNLGWDSGTCCGLLVLFWALVQDIRLACGVMACLACLAGVWNVDFLMTWRDEQTSCYAVAHACFVRHEGVHTTAWAR